MRALKSVLVTAGSLKRGSTGLPEETVLIRAMRESNIPKFLSEDARLFDAIVCDLFPGTDLPEQVCEGGGALAVQGGAGGAHFKNVSCGDCGPYLLCLPCLLCGSHVLQTYSWIPTTCSRERTAHTPLVTRTAQRGVARRTGGGVRRAGPAAGAALRVQGHPAVGHLPRALRSHAGEGSRTCHLPRIPQCHPSMPPPPDVHFLPATAWPMPTVSMCVHVCQALFDPVALATAGGPSGRRQDLHLPHPGRGHHAPEWRHHLPSRHLRSQLLPWWRRRPQRPGHCRLQLPSQVRRKPRRHGWRRRRRRWWWRRRAPK
mgnify:CR=1 FL=1